MFRLDFYMEANNMNPDQTGFLSSLIWVHIICNIGNDRRVFLFICLSSSAKAFEAIRCGMFIVATQLIPDLPVKAGLHWIYLGSAVFCETAQCHILISFLYLF